jgi:hypothetical protein
MASKSSHSGQNKSRMVSKDDNPRSNMTNYKQTAVVVVEETGGRGWK